MSRLGFQGWGGNHSSPWLYLVFVFIWKRLSVRLLKFAFCCPLQQHMFWGKRFVPTGVPLSRVLVPAIPTLLEPHRDSCHPSSDFGGRWNLVGSGGWCPDGESRGVRPCPLYWLLDPVPGTRGQCWPAPVGTRYVQAFGDAWICGVGGLPAWHG